MVDTLRQKDIQEQALDWGNRQLRVAGVFKNNQAELPPTDDYKFIADENRPEVYREINKPIVVKDDADYQAKNASLKNEVMNLPGPVKAQMSAQYEADSKNFKTVDDRLNYLRDKVVSSKYSMLPEPMKQQLESFANQNNLTKEQRREIVAQAVLLPAGSIEKLLTFAGSPGNKEFSGQAMKDFSKIFVDQQVAEKNPIDIVKTVDKIKENINALKSNAVLRDYFESSSDIKSLLDTKPEDFANVTGGFQGIVPLVFSVAQRPGMIGTAALMATKAYFQKDPEKAAAWNLLAKRTFEDAGPSNGSMWVPPKSGFDTLKLYDFVLGKDKLAETDSAGYMLKETMQYGSAINKMVTGHITEGLKDWQTTSELRNKINADFMKKEGIDTLEYTKRQLHNLGVTTLGLIASVATDPISYVGKVIKLGSSGTKVMSVARKEVPMIFANKGEIIKASKKIESALIDSASEMNLRVDMNGFYLNSLSDARAVTDDIMRSVENVASRSSTQQKLLEDAVKFRDMNSIFEQLSEVKDSMIRIDEALKVKDITYHDAQSLARQLKDNGDIFINLSKQLGLETKPFTSGGSAQVLVKSGMQRLSKSGEKVLGHFNTNSPIYTEAAREAAEYQLAKAALDNPSLIDDGGVKILGMQIPGSAKAQKILLDTMRSVPFINRFPGLNNQAARTISKYFQAKEGETALAMLNAKSLQKGLTREQSIRVSLAIETKRIDILDNTIRINENGTLQDIARIVKRKNDDTWMANWLANRDLVQTYMKRGMTEAEAIKFMEKNGGDVAGDYIKNYQTQIYKNQQGVRILKEREKRLKGEVNTFIKNDKVDASAFNRFSMERTIPSTADAFKVFVKDPKKQIEIDKAIENIVNNIEVSKNINFLTRIGKDGLDPELGFAEKYFASASASSRAIAKRRMNIELAEELGIPTSMSKYMEEASHYVDVNAVEFQGIAMPKDVQQALKYIDAPTTKMKLESELGGATWKQIIKDEAIGHPATEFGSLNTAEKLTSIQMGMKKSGLGLLKAYDSVNNFFRGAVTVIYPKFHTRNALSNVFMNYQDVGIKAFDPRISSKAMDLLSGNAEKIKGVVFTNKYGQIVTGSEMLAAARESGVFTTMGKVADVRSEAEFSIRNLKAPISKMVNAAKDFMPNMGQKVEDIGRLSNFVANWENGNSFWESALRGKKMMVDYNNLSSFEKTWVSRTVPFYAFFKNNFINSMETLIKNPERILLPPKVLAHVLNSNIKTQEGLPDQKYSSDPVYGDQYTDKTTGHQMVKQVTSLGIPVEDVDRYTKVIQEAWKGYRYLSMGASEASEDSFSNAGKMAMTNLMPSMQIGVGFVNEITGGKLFNGKRLTPELEDYLLGTPQWLREMAGVRIGQYKEHSEPFLEISPMANIFFNTLGGGRALSTAGVITSEQGETVDKVMNLFSPFSTRLIDLDTAKQMKLNQDAKQAKAVQDMFNAALKDLGKKAEGEAYLQDRKKKKGTK